jgi:hypothetical protein
MAQHTLSARMCRASSAGRGRVLGIHLGLESGASKRAETAGMCGPAPRALDPRQSVFAAIARRSVRPCRPLFPVRPRIGPSSFRAAQGLLVDFFDLEAACSSSRCLRESPIISRQMRSST